MEGAEQMSPRPRGPPILARQPTVEGKRVSERGSERTKRMGCRDRTRHQGRTRTTDLAQRAKYGMLERR